MYPRCRARSVLMRVKYTHYYYYDTGKCLHTITLYLLLAYIHWLSSAASFVVACRGFNITQGNDLRMAVWRDSKLSLARLSEESVLLRLIVTYCVGYKSIWSDQSRPGQNAKHICCSSAISSLCYLYTQMEYVANPDCLGQKPDIWQPGLQSGMRLSCYCSFQKISYQQPCMLWVHAYEDRG